MCNLRSLVPSFALVPLFILAAGCGSEGGDPLSPEETAVASSADTASLDCLGGALTDGVCQPFAIASGQQRPFALALDGNRVYFSATTFYQINSTSILGGPPVTLASGGATVASPSGVAVTGGYVLWATEADGKIWRAAPGSFSPDPVAIATGQSTPLNLVTDGVYAYWTNYGNGTVARVKVRPGASDGVETVASGLTHPWGLAVHAGHAYVADAGNGSSGGSISAIDLASLALTTLASGGSPRGVAADDSAVYFADNYNGTINKVPVAGGAVTALASGQNQPVGLLVDAQYVTWTSYGGGFVARTGLGGGAVTTLATAQRHPISITEDAQALYWVNDEWDTTVCAAPPCGAVMKLAS
jgi:hypothetical protein